VQQMSKFVMQFAQQSEQLNSAREQINVDLKQKLENVYSVDSLIQQFLAQKGTGHELPEVAEFVEFVPGTINDVNASTASVDSGGGIASTSSYFSLRKRSPPRKVLLESNSYFIFV
jgi:ABC-type proline/glycine betaine transport system substrate-binding protein